MKVANGYEYVKVLEEQIAPPKFAMAGDPIGLQVGDLTKKVRKIMFTLDVLESVVDEAIEKGIDMIIAHHPFFYRPVHKIDMTTSQGKIIRKLLHHNIIVYATHTNLDIAPGGVNDILARLLNLENTKLIVPTYTEQYVKIAVFTPLEAEKAIRDALSKSGAGEISTDYECCSFSYQGLGRFKSKESASPYTGEVGKLTQVNEMKIETICPRSKYKQILDAVKLAHPYEEAAIDVYQLENVKGHEGLGRLGVLKKEKSIESFVEEVKSALGLTSVRFIGDKKKMVQRVAILGGDGNKFIHDAKKSGADILITGDIYYHTAHELLSIDLPTIDAGHNIEKVMKKYLKDQLGKIAERFEYSVELFVSETNTDPFLFL